MRTRPFTLALLACTAAIAAVAPAETADQYWNQMRGPNGDGKSSATNLPVEFGEECGLEDSDSRRGLVLSGGLGQPDLVDDRTRRRIGAVCDRGRSRERRGYSRHQGLRRGGAAGRVGWAEHPRHTHTDRRGGGASTFTSGATGPPPSTPRPARSCGSVGT